MTKLFEKHGNVIIADRTVDRSGACELCGKVDDLRPYGPNNENICFDCGMKDEETTKKKFIEILEGQT